MTALTRPIPGTWTDVCRLDMLVPERGAAALVGDDQIALFRIDVGGGETVVFAIDHCDPISRSNVLARGIVGYDDGRWYVASPLHKERYDLETGACLTVEGVGVRTWSTAVVDGIVAVGDERHAA